jgi:hypothetical protein
MPGAFPCHRVTFRDIRPADLSFAHPAGVESFNLWPRVRFWELRGPGAAVASELDRLSALKGAILRAACRSRERPPPRTRPRRYNDPARPQ